MLTDCGTSKDCKRRSIDRRTGDARVLVTVRFVCAWRDLDGGNDASLIIVVIVSGFILAGVRCYVLHCGPLPVESPVATPIPPPTSEQAPAVAKGTLDLLVGHQSQPETDALMQHREFHHHHQHHNYHHHNNHKKKRSSQGSHSEEA